MQVRLPSALANVLATRIDLTVLRRVLPAVVEHWKDLLPADGDADRINRVEDGGVALVYHVTH
jgi:hypothetical protein